METNQNEIHITPPVAEVTEIVCVIDRSGSMGSLASKTIEGYNTFLNEQRALPGIAKWTLCLFDGGDRSWKETAKAYEIVTDGLNIQDVPELDNKVYTTGGSTAMYDAIGATITAIYDRVKDSPTTKVMFMIMTDGEENASKEYTQKQVFDMIKTRQETDKWGFIFLGANIDTMQAGMKMSMSKGSTMAFSATDAGVQNAYMNMSSSTAMYRSISKSKLMDDDSVLDTLLTNNGTSKEDLEGNK